MNREIKVSEEVEISYKETNPGLSVLESNSTIQFKYVLVGSVAFIILSIVDLFNCLTANKSLQTSCISEMMGLMEMSDPDDVFVIWKFPHDVFKIKWDTLKNEWDNIWQSPADDALILYIPNKKIVLVTHWDVIYYS